VSTVGGVRLMEPGADLAIALALASAFTERAIPHRTVAFGEISLAGEIRPVASGKQRAAEAQRLGFTTRIDDSAAHIRQAVHAAFETADERDIPQF
jgi:DNA repair protein RadA/Sms